MAGISFRSYASASEAGGSTITIPLPTGTVEADIMVAFLTSDEDGAFSADASTPTWNELEDSEHAGVGNTFASAVYWAEVPANPDANFGFTQTTFALAGHILTFQHTSGTWDTPVSTMTEVTGTSLATGSLTAALNDAIAAMWANDDARTLNVAPSGMTLNEETTQGSLSLVSYYEESLATGSVTRTQTYSTSGDVMAGAVLLSDTDASGPGAGATVIPKYYRQLMAG